MHVAGFGINALIPGHEAPGGAVIDQLSDNAPAHVVRQPEYHGLDTARS